MEFLKMFDYPRVREWENALDARTTRRPNMSRGLCVWSQSRPLETIKIRMLWDSMGHIDPATESLDRSVFSGVARSASTRFWLRLPVDLWGLASCSIYSSVDLKVGFRNHGNSLDK